MKKLTLVLLLAILSACGSHPQPVRTQTVNVPVAVSCQPTPVPEPHWNLPALPPTASYSLKVQAAFEDLALARAYAGKLSAELNACR